MLLRISLTTLFLSTSIPVSAQIDLNSNKFEWSGFARIIGGTLNQSQASYYGYDDSLNFDRHSLLGLQGKYYFNEDLSVTAMGVWHANKDFDSGVEWLYLTYQPTDALTFKVGQMQTPFYAYSDVLDVGYAYPWTAAPRVVYNDFIFKHFQGINGRYSYGGDSYTINVEAYTGEFDGDTVINNVQFPTKVEELSGVISDLRYGPFKLRAGYHVGDVSVTIDSLKQLQQGIRQLGFEATASSLNTESKGEFFQFSLQYETLNDFIKYEWIRVSPEAQYYATMNSWYVTYGHLWGDWTGLITYAKRQDDLEAPENEIPKGVNANLDILALVYQQAYAMRAEDDYSTITLGLRWDFKANMALKAEYSLIDVKQQQNAIFVTSDGASFDNKGALLLFGMEWIF